MCPMWPKIQTEGSLVLDGALKGFSKTEFLLLQLTNAFWPLVCGNIKCSCRQVPQGLEGGVGVCGFWALEYMCGSWVC